MPPPVVAELLETVELVIVAEAPASLARPPPSMAELPVMDDAGKREIAEVVDAAAGSGLAAGKLQGRATGDREPGDRSRRAAVDLEHLRGVCRR